MEKKIYCLGLDDETVEAKVQDAVSGVAGVSSVVASALKAQVCVNFDESVAGIEYAINAAITSVGLDVLG